jgi:hypothetical protein
MFSWYPVMDLASAPRRTARKKGSGYENADDFEKLVPRLLAVTECCVITNLVSHDRKMARMIVMPKDAKPEEVRELYDDFATTYDEVCYKYYLLYVLMMNVQRPVV